MRSRQQITGQQRLGRWMIILGWLGVVIVLTLLFQHVLDRQRNPNSDPDTRLVEGVHREVVLRRSRAGHYVASGEIEGHAVEFLLDTGATSVAIPQVLARRVGLRFGARVIMNTANGKVAGWSTELRSVQLGNIVERDVPAIIMPESTGGQVLLGMSFLRRLEFEQRSGTLTLRQRM